MTVRGVASCAVLSLLLVPGSWGQGEDEVLRAYHRLAPYCPDDMESLMLVQASEDPASFASRVAPNWVPGGTGSARALRAVVVGRGFRMRGVSYGDFEGVAATEFDGAIRDAASESLRKSDGFREVTIADVRCFERERALDEGLLEEWYAFPEADVGLFATRRSLLVDALARTGPEIAARMRASGFEALQSDAACPILILRRYDGSNEHDVYSPKNTKYPGFAPLTRSPATERLRFELGGSGPEFTAVVDSGDLDSALEYFRQLLGDGTHTDLRPPIERERGRLSFRGRFRTGSDPAVSDEAIWLLQILQVFGYNVFI